MTGHAHQMVDRVDQRDLPKGEAVDLHPRGEGADGQRCRVGLDEPYAPDHRLAVVGLSGHLRPSCLSSPGVHGLRPPPRLAADGAIRRWHHVASPPLPNGVDLDAQPGRNRRHVEWSVEVCSVLPLHIAPGGGHGTRPMLTVGRSGSPCREGCCSTVRIPMCGPTMWLWYWLAQSHSRSDGRSRVRVGGNLQASQGGRTWRHSSWSSLAVAGCRRLHMSSMTGHTLSVKWYRTKSLGGGVMDERPLTAAELADLMGDRPLTADELAALAERHRQVMAEPGYRDSLAEMTEEVADD